MVSDSQGRSSLNTRCRLWIVKAAKMHRSAVNYKPRTDQCVLAKDKSLSQKHAYKENRQTEGRSPPEAWLWLLVMRADLWVKCLARGGRFLRSLLETPKGPCVFPLCAAGPRMCDCLPMHQLGAPVLDGSGEASKQSELGPCQAVAHPVSSNLLHWHSQEGGRPAQEQRDSLTSQMVTHTKPARYLGWADLTISPFKDYPLNCPSHTPPLAPAWAFCKDEQYLKERLPALISAPWAVKPILL